MRLMKMTLVAVALLLAMTTMAQKQFTLEDLNFGGTNYKNMVPANRTLVWWGDKLVRLDGKTCLGVNVRNGKETAMFTADELNSWAGLTDEASKLKSVAGAAFPYVAEPLVLVSNGEKRMLIDFKKHKLVWQQGCKGETATDWNAVSRNVAFVKDDNLYVGLAGGTAVKLTTDGSRDIVYGQSVHRNEFGISKGTFWSHDGKKLAFYRMDQSMVADYPLVNIPELDFKPENGKSRMATPAPEKYPMAGETSHKVTVGVWSEATGKVTYLKAGDPTDRYFTNIAWSPDDKTIYMFELNRDQNDCRLVSYDAESGNRIAEIYRETDERYVEPQHKIVFLPWDKTKFIMQSQKDGYNHLYVMDAAGKQVKQLTSGKWVVMEMLGFDESRHSVVIASNESGDIRRNLYEVNVETGKRTLIDASGNGWHTGKLSASGRYVVDNYQAPDVPRKIAVADLNTGRKLNYFTAEDPWKGYAVPEYSCGTIKAADGTTDLYYRMVKPVGFDPGKKYPTVVYVYGGPHAHNVDEGWHYRSRSWETYMAQKGYLLFILDNRGSENRGRAFEQVTFRHLGQEEMKDQMKGVEYLKSLAYVDTTRLGVHGWSFGGFMTISLMTNYPDVFKVGVAGGPVIDWKWYEVMYGERYMDTPQTNPDGYAQTSLLGKAKNLKGRLQIIIGLNDPVVVPQHAYSFLKACIKDGTQPDFFVYPGEPHNMRGHQSVHLHERITRYFDDYLK